MRRNVFSSSYRNLNVAFDDHLIIYVQVAILDGITMGAGAGIALPGMFRVVTDKTVCGCCLLYESVSLDFVFCFGFGFFFCFLF